MRRVFVTGIGCVTPIGKIETLSGRILFKASLALPGSRRFPLTICQSILVVKSRTLISTSPASMTKSIREDGPRHDFAVVSSGEAIKDAKLDTKAQGNRVGCFLGSGLPALLPYKSKRRTCSAKSTRVSPFTIPVLMPECGGRECSLAYYIIGASLLRFERLLIFGSRLD